MSDNKPALPDYVLDPNAVFKDLEARTDARLQQDARGLPEKCWIFSLAAIPADELRLQRRR
jgi:hypothetical protein